MPSGLTIEDNLVYVADKGNKRIAVFDDEGNFIKEFTHPNMTVPRSVKFYKKNVCCRRTKRSHDLQFR